MRQIRDVELLQESEQKSSGVDETARLDSTIFLQLPSGS